MVHGTYYNINAMLEVKIKFHGELNDFSSGKDRNKTLKIQLNEHSSVKDVIESRGVPHPEVLLILVNGKAAGFDYNVQDSDGIEVFPFTGDSDIKGLVENPLPEPKFVLDVHLGTLARKLRLLGFDTYYRNNLDDPEIAEIAGREERIVLTRDIGLLMRGCIKYGRWIRSQHTDKQTEEVIKRFRLSDRIKPFSICINCSGELAPAPKESVKDDVEADTYTYYDEFLRCRSCGQVYWKGSHFKKLLKTVNLRKARE